MLSGVEARHPSGRQTPNQVIPVVCPFLANSFGTYVLVLHFALTVAIFFSWIAVMLANDKRATR